LVDVFGGIVTGTLGYFIGSWLMRKPRALPQALLSPSEHEARRGLAAITRAA
jgi:hypothetical protein